MRRDPEQLIAPRSPELATPVASRLVCHCCGHQVPLDEIRPYRCRAAETHDNCDHVLRRVFDASIFRARSDPDATFREPELNPFHKYRRLFYSYEIARLGGITDSAYVGIVDRLDAAIGDIDGSGFRGTPFAPSTALARVIDLDAGRLWVKDETGNVSGSHKARHLMGIMIWLEVIRALRRPEGTAPKLAIASCGNAALAAAEVARAAGRPLEVFVPPDANPRVLSKLTGLGAELTTCPRRAEDPSGDPCYLRFLEAWTEGALPFTVQGKRNGMTIEGGCTLAWEIVSSLLSSKTTLDHLVIQVGGGALAASCIHGLRDALSLGLIERLPRIHTVQTRSAFPLRRAYDLLAARILDSASNAVSAAPTEDLAFDFASDDIRSLKIRDQIAPETVASGLSHATSHRPEFMWPWETPPKSIAYGILDDETYDWIAVTEGMLETGGIPVVVSESTLAAAHRLAREHTPIPVDPTGSAGMAGLIELQGAGVIRPEETVAILFTGMER